MDKALFNNLIFSNANRIYFYAYCILKNQEQALKVVLLSLDECWNQRKLIGEGDLTFVFRIARNFCINQAALNRFSIEGQESLTLNLENNPSLMQFCSQISGLSPIQTHVISLRNIAGLRAEEISIVLELGLNNVNSILADVRKKIRSDINSDIPLELLNCHELVRKFYSGNTSKTEEEQLILLSKKEDSELSEIDKKSINILYLQLDNLPDCCEDFLKQHMNRLQNSNRKSIFQLFRRK